MKLTANICRDDQVRLTSDLAMEDIIIILRAQGDRENRQDGDN